MLIISKIILKDIRGFKKLELNFSDSNNNNNMQTIFIGRNGTCKTTLLRCIAIGLCDVPDANGLISEPFGNFISEGKKSATINLFLVLA